MHQIDATTYRSPNYDSRHGAAITLLVLHATVGSAKSSLQWLCNPASKVSTHYLISKSGYIWQLVDDADRAWHAGDSSYQGRADCNTYSIGIELENNNSGTDPYPSEQLNALNWLTQQLVTAHPTLASVATHAEVAINPPGRKTDPVGFPIDAFRAWFAGLLLPPPPRYSELSPLLSAPIADRARRTFIIPVSSEYTQTEANEFFDEYWRIAPKVGIDPILAIAQMLHETGDLTSWWCQRPRRNPAGIGVTGETKVAPIKPPGDWSRDGAVWRAGVNYRTWVNDAIPDHIGRLLAYALPINTGTIAQQALIKQAMSRRKLPESVRGSSQILRTLGRVYNPSGLGWASPGDQYGAAIALRANVLIGVT